MQTASSQLTKGGGGSGSGGTSGQEGPPACQLTNRKARSAKPVDLQSPSLAASPLPHRGLAADDAEYDNLIGAMDNDLDRPEPLRGETLQEPSSQLVQSKGRHACWPQDAPSAVTDGS